MSRQLTERGEAFLVRCLPRPRAWWLAGRGEAFLLVLPPFTPVPTLVREIIILFEIYVFQ